ncbi:hypothetical protein [Bradyrhizobium sp. STM 3843]|uniref:hypothetical protein n=1 Tax=Bradyrhizobium sp. STM 3843 TaxID=551947 RepID=UPI00056B09CE
MGSANVMISSDRQRQRQDDRRRPGDGDEVNPPIRALRAGGIEVTVIQAICWTSNRDGLHPFLGR